MTRVLSLATAVCVLASLAACGAESTEVTEPDETTTTVATTTTTTTLSAVAAEPWAERDLVYATRIDNGVEVMLDMYFPADPTDAPIVIEGEEDWVEFGWIVVKGHETDALGLAGGPEAMVADRESVRAWGEVATCAIRTARERAAELGNAAPKVVFVGFSLFGNVATQVGLLGETFDQRWEEFAAAGGPAQQLECTATSGSTHVDAVISVGGAYDLAVPVIDGTFGRAYQRERDPEMQEFLASIIGVNRDVALRFIHGTNDGIPAEYASELADVLADAGYDVELTTWPGEHEFPPDDILMPILMEVVGG